MTFVAWIAFSAIGIAIVYRIGLRIERWSPAIGIVYLVLFAPAAMIGSWMAAHQIVGADQATCEDNGSECGPAERHVAIGIPIPLHSDQGQRGMDRLP